MADGRCPDMSAVDILKASQQCTELIGMHIGATLRIPLIRPCVAAMHPFVKLL